MKQAIIIVVAFLVGFVLLAVSVEAAQKLIKATEFAQVGIGSNMVIVNKVVDGDVTCYVSQHAKFGTHQISCVK